MLGQILRQPENDERKSRHSTHTSIWAPRDMSQLANPDNARPLCIAKSCEEISFLLLPVMFGIVKLPSLLAIPATAFWPGADSEEEGLGKKEGRWAGRSLSKRV